MSTDICRVSTDELVQFMLCFHLLGWSFGGNISENDLLLTCNDNMRALLDKWDVLGQKKDAASVAKMIRSSIFNVTPASDLPEDIKHLLGLLEDYSPALVEAVK